MAEGSDVAVAACPNCNATNFHKYCAECGQKRPEDADYSLRGVVIAAIQRVTQYDGRLLRTVRTLLSAPGQLERDHFEGRRARYVAPFELFVIANVAAWFVVPYLHIYGFSMAVAAKLSLLKERWPAVFAWRAALSHTTPELLAPRMDAAAASVNKLTLLTMVPAFAALMKLLRPRAGTKFVQYMIFSVHFYCVHMLTILSVWGLMMIPAYRVLVAHPELAWGHVYIALWRSNTFGHFVVAPALFAYLNPAIRRAFDLGPRSAAWRAVLLTVAACSLLRSFFDVGCAIMLVVA